eukprot:m.69967 g.69967  ORF g.69967 m.69967 type:complete len:397 (-) comp12094_c0_seq2:34-1224(-)
MMKIKRQQFFLLASVFAFTCKGQVERGNYIYVSERRGDKGYQDAINYCQRKGGNLIWYDSPAEQAWSRRFGNQFRVMCDDIRNEGNFTFPSPGRGSCAKSAGYDWHGGEPNNSGNEDCVEMKNHRFNDGGCHGINSIHTIVCKKDKPTSSSTSTSSSSTSSSSRTTTITTISLTTSSLTTFTITTATTVTTVSISPRASLTLANVGNIGGQANTTHTSLHFITTSHTGDLKEGNGAPKSTTTTALIIVCLLVFMVIGVSLFYRRKKSNSDEAIPQININMDYEITHAVEITNNNNNPTLDESLYILDDSSGETYMVPQITEGDVYKNGDKFYIDCGNIEYDSIDYDNMGDAMTYSSTGESMTYGFNLNSNNNNSQSTYENPTPHHIYKPIVGESNT